MALDFDFTFDNCVIDLSESNDYIDSTTYRWYSYLPAYQEFELKNKKTT